MLGCMNTLATRDDVTGKLGQIKVPALVVHGDKDAAIELGLAETLAAGLPNAKLVVVPGGGHAANLTHPEAVNPAIERFLDGAWLTARSFARSRLLSSASYEPRMPVAGA